VESTWRARDSTSTNFVQHIESEIECLSRMKANLQVRFLEG
jgi:hypothetical protein